MYVVIKNNKNIFINVSRFSNNACYNMYLIIIYDDIDLCFISSLIIYLYTITMSGQDKRTEESRI